MEGLPSLIQIVWQRYNNNKNHLELAEKKDTLINEKDLSPDINPHTYGHLIFIKNPKMYTEKSYLT